MCDVRVTVVLQNIAWVEELKRMLQPLSSGSYVNYIDPLMQGGRDV
jgi:hypothetical protein